MAASPSHGPMSEWYYECDYECVNECFYIQSIVREGLHIQSWVLEVSKIGAAMCRLV